MDKLAPPLRVLAAVVLALAGAWLRPCDGVDRPVVGLQEHPGRLVITVDNRPVVVYVYRDERITRPYFAHVKAPDGTQATRNHPPVEGTDRTDHDTMHPGIWMAFGDLGGEDFWRNKAPVVHEAFVEAPAGGFEVGRFAVRNRYERSGGGVVCREICRIGFHVRPAGYLVEWDSTFFGDEPFAFGDQEEMGLGLRVATPISVDRGGEMVDSEGRRNGGQIWGNTARWCDYRGMVDGRLVGMAVLCHPDNFRPSWMHARDYGFVAANPFGRKAFGKGSASREVVEPGERFRLRYGVLIHSGAEDRPPEMEAAWQDYVRMSRSP